MGITSIPVGIWSDPTTNKDLLKTGIRMVFDNTDTKAIIDHPKMFHTTKVDQFQVSDFRMAGLGEMAETGDGQPARMEAPVFGTRKDFDQVKYTNGFRVSDMMQQYNRIQLVPRLTRNLKKKMQEGKDKEVFKIYNSASGTTYASGFDALALASTAHTCLHDTDVTFSNYLNADLTTAGYEAALKYFYGGIYDDRGQILPRRATRLCVNPSLVVKANQLTGADKKPFEQSNTPYKPDQYFGFSVTPFGTIRLTSSTSWFLIGDVGDEEFAGPTVFTGMEPDLKTEDAYDTSGDIRVYSAQHFDFSFSRAYDVYVGDL
jgi:hypothetical protein